MGDSERTERARLSLEGLSVADSLGAFFEGGNDLLAHYIKTRQAPYSEWIYSDDTNMALSIFWMLQRHGAIDQDVLAAHFAAYYDPRRGYGTGARMLLEKIRAGGNWRELSSALFQGGSFGNGAAMRVAPLGAYFADDLNMVMQQAARSAEVTHAHPEGIAGGVAVALGAAFAWRAGGDKPEIKDFLNDVASHLPLSEVRQGIEQAALLSAETPLLEAVRILGNGSRVSAQDTVPLALWLAALYMDDYPESVWQAISAGGDTDTTAAIVGGIVAVFGGLQSIPTDWLENRENLPDWAILV